MLKKTFDVNQLGDRLLELLTDIQNHIEVTLTRYGVALLIFLTSVFYQISIKTLLTKC